MAGDAPLAPGRDRWRFVPIVGWLRSYDRRWLRGDLIEAPDVEDLTNFEAVYDGNTEE